MAVLYKSFINKPCNVNFFYSWTWKGKMWVHFPHYVKRTMNWSCDVCIIKIVSGWYWIVTEHTSADSLRTQFCELGVEPKGKERDKAPVILNIRHVPPSKLTRICEHTDMWVVTGTYQNDKPARLVLQWQFSLKFKCFLPSISHTPSKLHVLKHILLILTAH
jgi:hypothetical protein